MAILGVNAICETAGALSAGGVASSVNHATVALLEVTGYVRLSRKPSTNVTPALAATDRRGGWAPSAIAGDPQRGVGILNNAIYTGRDIWNRSRWIKDPDRDAPCNPFLVGQKVSNPLMLPDARYAQGP
jgi:hypothetical protein